MEVDRCIYQESLRARKTSSRIRVAFSDCSKNLSRKDTSDILRAGSHAAYGVASEKQYLRQSKALQVLGYTTGIPYGRMNP